MLLISELPVIVQQALFEIEQTTDADVRHDDVSRLLYASDASIVQKIPFAVVYPRSEADCSTLIKIANELKIPVIARAGGTSLAGQVVGEAIILDFSRFMTGIVNICLDEKYAVVEPGLIVSELNKILRESGLMFAPDPSTLTRATISGLIGNNAWGAHSSRYGETVDNIISLRVALSSGEVIEIEGLTELELENKLNAANQESLVIKSVIQELEEHKTLLLDNYPIQHVPNNVGYALDKLIKLQPWSSQGDNFNLVPLICGSEGTLGLVTQIKLRLVPLPKHRLMMIVNFDSLLSAVKAVSFANQHNAVAVELLDEILLSLIADNKTLYSWLNLEAKALLVIEFQENTLDKVKDLAQRLEQVFVSQFSGISISTLENTEIDSVWNIRRSALGLLMGRSGSKKAVSFIEDSAVAVKHLPDFVADVQAIMSRLDTECVYYGSVSRGLVHLRPLLDLKLTQDKEKLNQITNEILKRLKLYAGSLSAKHGDGLVRGAYIETQVGAEIYRIMRRIKSVFDPNNILNPGKLFDTADIKQNLREATTQNTTEQAVSFYDWRPQGGLLAAAEKCNGAAVCRRQSGAAMCPSYQATLEEKDTTRGRANMFRQMLAFSQGDISKALNDQRLHEVLTLCLSCKACMADCPAGVNMARLKSEHLQHYYKKHAVPLLVHLLKHLEKLNSMASFAPQLFNKVVQSRSIKSLLEVHPNRRLPILEKSRLSSWFQSRDKTAVSGNQNDKLQVLLLNDVFSEFYTVDIAKKAIMSLEKLGYAVTLSPLLPSLRIMISSGMVDEAKKRITQSLDYLNKAASNNIAIIGLEPSELLSYRDEVEALLFDEKQKQKARVIADKAFLFDEFIVKHLTENSQAILHWSEPNTKFFVHTHCHQKSLVGSNTFSQCLKSMSNVSVQEIESGCCGMAGFFGYEKDNYDLSQKIANQYLFPAIRKAPSNSIIVAAGFSCRHQITEGLAVNALHPAEVIYIALGKPAL